MTMRLVIGVDIGGTKIKGGAVEVSPEGRLDRLVAARQIQTPRADPAAFYNAVAALVEALRADAAGPDGAIAPLVGVAHPGRLLPDGTLARGTTPNLGAAPTSFDGVHPAGELSRRLGATVFAENDAVAQLRCALETLLRDATVRPRLLGQTVVYLGPGTGMGGGVARVTSAGDVTTLTDGQFFDLQIPGYEDGTRTAEELFTGPAIARLVIEANRSLSAPIEPATAEQLGLVLADAGAPEEQRAAARRIADATGDVLALLIAAIHAGQIVKVRFETAPGGRCVRHVDEPDRAWSAADRASVRGAGRFVLGGSVGVSPVLGGYLRRRAVEQLAARGLWPVEIFQSPVPSADAGVRGALLAIPMEQLHQAAPQPSSGRR